MRIQRGVVVGACIAVIAVALSACGSSSTASKTVNSTPSSGGASPSGVVAATGTSVPVGVIGSFTGAQASSLAGVPKIMQAWASTVNANGGLAGHPVKLFIEDDAGVAAQSTVAVKRLVEQDKVVAIIGDSTGFDATWATYVQSKGVPIVGGLGIDTPFLSNSDFYATGTNAIAADYAVTVLAKANGNKLALLYCAESPQCAQAVPLFKGLSQATGISVPVATSVSGTAPDYTALCQEVKASGAQSLFIASGIAVTIRVAGACKAAGVTAKLVSDDGAVNNTVAGQPGSEGLTAAELTAPWFDKSVPATQAYQAALAKYAPNLGVLNGPNTMYGWVSGKLLEAAVKASGSTDVTSASVVKGLLALRGETLGGLTQPLTYTAGKPTLLNCYFTMSIVGGVFTTPIGLKTSCAPDAVISAIASKL